ncbi:hypothetical protein C4D60_Mb09t01820 [Musa balbisiana]|uniref:Uncharacterized protein n=1 Tax=Musa balbisiana TaxID=52838 RepID=A0A4S8IDF8_MUSBA|nr:hypothetical protein C4D60_Mb09t01810 [Musa balbisiana]THU46142.1 hypothetical protein C4D60_Mb09t01820 [Musa balbisiana]
MEENVSSEGPSLADQRDTSDHADLAKGKEESEEKNKKSGGGLKQGLEKTKAVASSGLKKVKEGSSTGFQWIKVLIHATVSLMLIFLFLFGFDLHILPEE